MHRCACLTRALEAFITDVAGVSLRHQRSRVHRNLAPQYRRFGTRPLLRQAPVLVNEVSAEQDGRVVESEHGKGAQREDVVESESDGVKEEDGGLDEAVGEVKESDDWSEDRDAGTQAEESRQAGESPLVVPVSDVAVHPGALSGAPSPSLLPPTASAALEPVTQSTPPGHEGASPLLPTATDGSDPRLTRVGRRRLRKLRRIQEGKANRGELSASAAPRVQESERQTKPVASGDAQRSDGERAPRIKRSRAVKDEAMAPREQENPRKPVSSASARRGDTERAPRTRRPRAAEDEETMALQEQENVRSAVLRKSVSSGSAQRSDTERVPRTRSPRATEVEEASHTVGREGRSKKPRLDTGQDELSNERTAKKQYTSREVSTGRPARESPQAERTAADRPTKESPRNDRKAAEHSPTAPATPYKDRREPWQIQKFALARKFGDASWQPRKRVSPDTLNGMRSLHEADPGTYTTEMLAQHFAITPEAVRRILKSKWRPSADEIEDRSQRWVKRGVKKWEDMAEQGLKPPKRWRAMGVANPNGLNAAAAVKEEGRAERPSREDRMRARAEGVSTGRNERSMPHPRMRLAGRIL